MGFLWASGCGSAPAGPRGCPLGSPAPSASGRAQHQPRDRGAPSRRGEAAAQPWKADGTVHGAAFPPAALSLATCLQAAGGFLARSPRVSLLHGPAGRWLQRWQSRQWVPRGDGGDAHIARGSDAEWVAADALLGAPIREPPGRSVLRGELAPLPTLL